MEMTELEIESGYDDPEHVRTLSQEEWDAANEIAQVRQGRARRLVVDHRTDYAVQLPVPARPTPQTPLRDGTFASPDQIRQRMGTGDRLRHLTLVDDTNCVVDWSECGESSDEHEPESEPLSFNDLREREIDLRGGRLLLDDEPRPAPMARAKLGRTTS